MRFSTIRTGVVASAAAIALAACGGHGLVPSQSAAPGSNAVVPMSSNPCYTSAVQPAWIFKGSCTIGKLPAKGATIKVAPYTAKKKIAITAKIPKSNGNGAPFVVVDAIAGAAKDIEPYKGAKFPVFKSTKVTSLVYVQAVNGFGCVMPTPSCLGLKFSGGSLTFITGAASFPGTTCYLSLLTQTKKGLSWLTTPYSGKVSKGKVTISVPALALGVNYPNGLPKGPLYLNLSCNTPK